MKYVVGSGPAGVACATALLRRGHRVTMLDAGIQIEDARRATVAELASTAPGAWKPAQLATLREGVTARRGRVPDKRAYGSDFTFRDSDRLLPMSTRGTDVRASLALGGLSNIWGGAILPYRAADLAGWPISPAELAPHYRAAAEWVPMSVPPSADLDEEFAIEAASADRLQPSRQAAALLADLDAHRAGLRAAGWRTGPARLAVRAGPSSRDRGCVYCGLCLHGCPYGLIYNAADTLASLRAHARFAYTGGMIVRRIRESGGRVVIHAESTQDAAPRTFEGARAYLACGVLSTTRIVLESIEAYDEPVTLQDSQYFLIPLLRRRRVPAPAAEPLHTLAQVFIEIDDPRVSRHNVHLQVYTYNDLFEQAIGATWLPRWLRERAIGRLLVIQGYLHSDESAPIALCVRRSPSSAPARVTLEAVSRTQTARAVRRVVRSLTRQRTALGAIPLTPFVQVCPSGRGYHCGGTLPMRRSPRRFESDAIGRPYGFTRLHVVDASGFTTIPAGPITLTVIANAHRIGSADVPP